ncbi:MAG: hypothetical protein ACP5NQ_09400 [Vulcanisaeta sp.]
MPSSRKLRELREKINDIDAYLKNEVTDERQAFYSRLNEAVGLCESIRMDFEYIIGHHYECKHSLPLQELMDTCSKLKYSKSSIDTIGVLEKLRGIIDTLESRVEELHRCILCEDIEEIDIEGIIDILFIPAVFIQELIFIMSAVAMRLAPSNMYASAVLLAIIMIMLALLNDKYGIYGILSSLPSILLGLGVGLISNIILYIFAIIALMVPIALILLLVTRHLMC